jgi:hypothetical protein
MKTVATPKGNYELKRSYKHLLSLLLFYLNNLKFSSAKFTFFKLYFAARHGRTTAPPPTESYLLVCGRRKYQAEG